MQGRSLWRRLWESFRGGTLAFALLLVAALGALTATAAWSVARHRAGERERVPFVPPAQPQGVLPWKL